MDFQTELDDLEALKTFFDELEQLLAELRDSFEQRQDEPIENGNNVEDIAVDAQHGPVNRIGRRPGHRRRRGIVVVPTNHFVRIRCHVNPIRRFMYRRIFRIHF